MEWDGFAQHKLRHFLGSQSWDGFGQNKLRYIFCVIVMRWVCFLSLCWHAQHMLRGVFYSLRHGLGLVNTS